MRRSSSSKKDEQYGVTLPTTYGAEVGVYAELPLISATIKRISSEVFDGDRGSFVYDHITDSYICHLIVNDADKKAVHPFLKDVEDVWMVIDAHSVSDYDGVI